MPRTLSRAQFGGPRLPGSPPASRRGRPEDNEQRGRIVPFYVSLGLDCYSTAARVWAKGVSPGIPDLYVFGVRWGVVFWHEVKVSIRQSQAQRLFEEQCAAARVPYVLGDLASAYEIAEHLGLGRRVGSVGFERARDADVRAGLVQAKASSWLGTDHFAGQRDRWGWRPSTRKTP